MLHKSPLQHSTSSSRVGGFPHREDPSSLPTMQPFWKVAVPFSMEREVKHCCPKHRSLLLQGAPSHTHSEFLTGTSTIKSNHSTGQNSLLKKERELKLRRILISNMLRNVL